MMLLGLNIGAWRSADIAGVPGARRLLDVACGLLCATLRGGRRLRECQAVAGDQRRSGGSDQQSAFHCNLHDVVTAPALRNNSVVEVTMRACISSLCAQ